MGFMLHECVRVFPCINFFWPARRAVSLRSGLVDLECALDPFTLGYQNWGFFHDGYAVYI